MPSVHFLDADSDVPEAVFDGFRNGKPGDLLVVDYHLPVYWRKGDADIALTAVYALEHAAERVRCFVCRRSPEVNRSLREHPADIETLARRFNTPLLDSAGPLPLVPVHIPKPWGEEIWYTGIEERGVASVGGEGVTVPLPWVLSAMPRRLCGGREKELTLLKILAPLPDPVYGDLYFELHEEKREVYVVTHVNRDAWPHGVGGIRFGFDPAKRAEYAREEAFRSAFAEAVKDYEAVRRDIDALLDGFRQKAGLALDEAVSPQQTERWMAGVPEALRERERLRRQAMESFTALLPLRVGDVVKVPTHTPHSLQHGVRAVEFQTPVYERLIVAFAQKVLTQDHWDTEQAVNLMTLDPPDPGRTERLREAGGVREERIVDFPDFEVRRFVVAPGASIEFSHDEDYALCMAVQGTLPLGDTLLEDESAALLPRGWRGARITNRAAAPLIFLAALPRAAGGA